MWGGTHFPVIQKFLEQNFFDILCFQEVTGPHTHCGNVHSEENQLEKLQKLLGKTHRGEIFTDVTFTSNPQQSFEGNAIFYKKDFFLVDKKEIVLYKGINPFPSNATSFEEMPRSALCLTLSIENKLCDIFSTHLAWAQTSTEHPHQRQQNLTLINEVSTRKNPWILTGDFNISPENQTILDLEKYGHDLIKEYHVENTIDEVNHNAWDRITPGFSVDYIFVSPDIHVVDFKALTNIHMSDHYGLVAEVEL